MIQAVFAFVWGAVMGTYCAINLLRIRVIRWVLSKQGPYPKRSGDVREIK